MPRRNVHCLPQNRFVTGSTGNVVRCCALSQPRHSVATTLTAYSLPSAVIAQFHERQAPTTTGESDEATAKKFWGCGPFRRLALLLLRGRTVAANAACQLPSPTGNIQRVVYVVFDNVHLRRDNPNVPSDLEQMPNLLNFILNNGVISGNHHTPLISHTATDILTALTGNYGDPHGRAGCQQLRLFPGGR